MEKLKCQRDGCDNYLKKGKYYCSISCSQKGIPKPKISKALSGRKNTKHSERMKKWWGETINKENMIENNPILQKGHTPWNKNVPCLEETKQLLSEVIKKQFEDGREISNTVFKKGLIPWNKDINYDEEIRNKISKMMKKLWQNPEYVQKQMLARNLYPNKAELYLQDIINSIFFEGQFKFIGDGQQIIGSKCPDFIDTKSNKLIELYGDYWHRGQDPNDRINYFKDYGYDCLVIWEHELKDLDSLKIRLLKFGVD